MFNRFLIIAILTAGIVGCDPEGRKKCVWTLEPEPNLIGKTDAGLIPLCARNRETMKQDCRLQSTIKFAKKAFKKRFKYVDMKVKSYGIPRTIDTIKFCD